MNGEAFEGGSAENYELAIGSGNFIEGFEEGLIGVAVGETATISLVMPREVDKTWYLAPVLLAEGVQDLDYTISSITLDGAEILDTVNLNAREAGNWWYEATGVFTDKQAIRLAAATMLGSAKMVLDTGKHPESLRKA